MTWLVAPVIRVPEAARPSLCAALLTAPAVVVMAAVTGLTLTVTSALRTGHAEFWILSIVELALLLLRVHAIRAVRRSFAADELPSIDRSVLLAIAWCALQGLSALAITLTGDMVLIVIATAFILGMVAPICARNYPAPRLAVLMVMLCDTPFKIGLALSGEPLLWLLLPMTLPLFIGVKTLLHNFGSVLARSLEAAEHNRHLAGHDTLTGLVNRHGVDERLPVMTATPARPLTLICIDLDRFKPVNDRYGHAAGDSVLVEVAARLRHVAPAIALIARLGGDEFVVAVPDLSSDDARSLAERVMHALSRRQYHIDDGLRLRIGASVGYACFPDDADTATVLRRHADTALYASKHSGQVRRYADPATGRVDAA